MNARYATTRSPERDSRQVVRSRSRDDLRRSHDDNNDIRDRPEENGRLKRERQFSPIVWSEEDRRKAQEEEEEEKDWSSRQARGDGRRREDGRSGGDTNYSDTTRSSSTAGYRDDRYSRKVPIRRF